MAISDYFSQLSNSHFRQNGWKSTSPRRVNHEWLAHIIRTTDAISGFKLTDLKNRPHIVEGESSNDLTIYFEIKASLQTYLEMPVEQPERDLSRTPSNPTDDYSG